MGKPFLHLLTYCLLVVTCDTVIMTKSVGNIKDKSVDTCTMYPSKDQSVSNYGIVRKN